MLLEPIESVENKGRLKQMYTESPLMCGMGPACRQAGNRLQINFSCEKFFAGRPSSLAFARDCGLRFS